MEKEIKKAMDLAEQEIQEKTIEKFKGIIKNLLEKKTEKEEEKRKIENEISIIKKTIDDFKAGRLDKVKELMEKDNIAGEILPFRITIINRPVITQPWGWNYSIDPYYSVRSGSPSITFTSTNPSLTDSGFSGTTCGVFATGTYNLNNGRTINL